MTKMKLFNFKGETIKKVKVCLLGKRESYDKVANIKVTKNVQVYETGTIVYSKTKSSKTR